MSNVAKIAVPLLLLAVVGGGVFYFANQGDHGAPPAPVSAPPAVQPSQTHQPEVKPAAAETSTQQQPNVREAPRSNGNADAAQGVRGRVLLPTGGPAANVPVMLIESATNNPIEMFIMNAAGKTKPPLVMSQTAEDGTFALGLPQPGKAVDLRVASAEHPEYNQPQIKVAAGDWYNAPDITLSIGLVVYGRVVDTTTKAPIPNATVYMASSHQTHTMMATPGRERGTPATTDPSGAFRFANAPRIGLVNLIAEAPGYASSQQLNKQLSAEHPTEVNLDLEVGQPIAGVVVDGDGKPIPGTRIAATGLSAKTPQSASASTEDDGSFAFPTLRPGPYYLVASSPKFAEVKVPLVLTGETDVKVVMSTKGSVKLRVLAANGSPVKSYRLSLKRSHPGNQMGIGNVMDYADRSVNPSDYPVEYGREWAVLRGLPSGEFRWQITESSHAKTLSPPFTIVEGGPPVEVQATLTMGGVLVGTVIDDRGQPVAGATVTTDMNGGIAADTGFLEIFKNMIPEKHTRASERTDSQGRFRITKLAFADYMVRAQHPDYCEGTAINLKLEEEGQQVDAGVIQLSRGAIVEGVTLVDGVPTGQIKVNLSVPMTAGNIPDPPKPGTPPRPAPPTQQVLFNANVLSDGEGHFRLLKRVPPGTYKATASRSGENPFESLMDLKASERQVVVAPGQDVVHLEFTLPKR